MTSALSPLFTDRYTLRMGQLCWRAGLDEPVSFELFVRSLREGEPPFLMAAGLERVLRFLEGLEFDPARLEYLRQQGVWDHGYLEYLSELRFSGEVWALPEGTVSAPGTPILRVRAPRIQAGLVESALLAMINHQSRVATKAAGIVRAAQGRPVFDFSLRRDDEPEASLGTSLASYLAGFVATSCEEAGYQYGIPTVGTVAHQFIMQFGPEREEEAMMHMLRGEPEGSAVTLIDTYQWRRGLQRAIQAARETGITWGSIRLDSGDLAEQAHAVREAMDAAGYPETKVVASNDLDAGKIGQLLAGGAPIDSFGVGTMLTVPDGRDSRGMATKLGGVYKCTTGELGPIMKTAEGKQTDPGDHQVFRQAEQDVLALCEERLEGKPLLRQVLRAGRRTEAGSEPWEVKRARAERELLRLSEAHWRGEARLRLTRSPALLRLSRELGGTMDASVQE